jgi:hypothetical protein
MPNIPAKTRNFSSQSQACVDFAVVATKKFRIPLLERNPLLRRTKLPWMGNFRSIGAARKLWFPQPEFANLRH